MLAPARDNGSIDRSGAVVIENSVNAYVTGTLITPNPS